MGTIILLYVNSSRRQMSCQVNVWVHSQLDSNLQTTFPVGILEHIGKWDSAFICLGKLRKLSTWSQRKLSRTQSSCLPTMCQGDAGQWQYLQTQVQLWCWWQSGGMYVIWPVIVLACPLPSSHRRRTAAAHGSSAWNPSLPSESNLPCCC